jgi:hypothetical protein
MEERMENPEKKITSYSEYTIWTTFPATIKWLQKERDVFSTKNKSGEFYERLRGINSTIILLSAACLEGFLVECLSCYTIGVRLMEKNTLEEKAEHAFLKKVSESTFSKLPELFSLKLGKPLEELIKDKSLIEGVEIIFKFRNKIAHAVSPIYQTHVTDFEDDIEYEMEKQYKVIHDYLKKKKLIGQNEDLFQGKIADHFASFVKPYMEAVLRLLPPIQSDNVKTLVAQAHRDKLISKA